MKYAAKRAYFVCVFLSFKISLPGLDDLEEEKTITSCLKRRRKQVCNVNRFIRPLHKYCFITNKILILLVLAKTAMKRLQKEIN